MFGFENSLLVIVGFQFQPEFVKRAVVALSAAPAFRPLPLRSSSRTGSRNSMAGFFFIRA